MAHPPVPDVRVAREVRLRSKSKTFCTTRTGAHEIGYKRLLAGEEEVIKYQVAACQPCLPIPESSLFNAQYSLSRWFLCRLMCTPRRTKRWL